MTIRVGDNVTLSDGLIAEVTDISPIQVYKDKSLEDVRMITVISILGEETVEESEIMRL